MTSLKKTSRYSLRYTVFFISESRLDGIMQEKTIGLISQAIARAPRWQLKKLTATYVTLHLNDIAKAIGIEKEEDVRRLLLSMVRCFCWFCNSSALNLNSRLNLPTSQQASLQTEASPSPILLLNLRRPRLMKLWLVFRISLVYFNFSRWRCRGIVTTLQKRLKVMVAGVAWPLLSASAKKVYGTKRATVLHMADQCEDRHKFGMSNMSKFVGFVIVSGVMLFLLLSKSTKFTEKGAIKTGVYLVNDLETKQSSQMDRLRQQRRLQHTRRSSKAPRSAKSALDGRFNFNFRDMDRRYPALTSNETTTPSEGRNPTRIS